MGFLPSNPIFVLICAIFCRSKSGFNETAIKIVLASSDALVQFRPLNVTNELLEFRRAMNQYNWTVEDILVKIMHPCNQMLKKCMWLAKEIPCDKLFRVSKTTQGFCCSFNYEGMPKYFAYTEQNILNTIFYKITFYGF